jgi:hypothetical protein
MSVAALKSVLDILTVVLLGLTFFAGAGVLITGNIINKRQSDQLKTFDSDITKAKSDLATQQERAATAEGKIAGLQKDASDAKTAQQEVETDLEKQKEKTAAAEKRLLELAERQSPRFVRKDAISSLLRGKATGTVTILYQPNDPEAYWFAFSLMGEISQGGWKVPSLPEPIPVDMTPRTPGFSDEQMRQVAAFEQRFPAAMRVGVGSGLTILARSIQDDQPAEGAYRVLTDALTSVKVLNGRRLDISLPQDSFILVVGPKP